MMRRIGRWVGISVVVAAALGGLTSCRPPSSTFTAVQLTDPDAVPGDGACRTTSGACSVQAAVARGQRGAKRQPGGRSVRLGGAPPMVARRVSGVSDCDDPARGIERSSPTV